MPVIVTDGDLAAAADAATAAMAADLLAHWWSRPVEAEVSAWIGAAAIESQVRRALGCPDPRSADALLPYSMDQVPDLLDEYECLFVGPGQLPCPPYESCWRDDVPIDIARSLMGPCTAELRELYRELGIDIAPEAGELPDHVAVELEALAYALTRADGRRVARELIRAHLSQWLPRLCKRVAAEARHRFYQNLAALTVDWFDHITRLTLASSAEAPGTNAAGESAPVATSAVGIRFRDHGPWVGGPSAGTM